LQINEDEYISENRKRPLEASAISDIDECSQDSKKFKGLTVTTKTSEDEKKDNVEPSKQYSNWLSAFFPPPYSNQISYTSEACLSYVTPFRMADKATKWILDTNYNVHGFELQGIVDATANIGGNTISFCRRFRYVTAIELNPDHFHCLRSNLELYYPKQMRLMTKSTSNSSSTSSSSSYTNLPSSSAEKISIFNANFINWWREERFKLNGSDFTGSDYRFRRYFKDCIFIDPPWGDSEYAKQEKIDDLYLDANEYEKRNPDLEAKLLDLDGSNNDPLKEKTSSTQQSRIENSKQTSNQRSYHVGMVELTKEIFEDRDVCCVVLKLPFNFNLRTLSIHFECYCFLVKKVQFIYIKNENYIKHK